jgi:hypothetical protein
MDPKKDKAPADEAEKENKAPSAKTAEQKAVEAVESFETKYAPVIRQKMKAGLSKEQALTVIRNQIKEDPKVLEAQLKELKK